VMVYKSGETTVDPSKIQLNIQQEEDAPVTNPYGAPEQPPTEQQKQDSANGAAQSLEDALKAPPAAPAEAPKK